MSKWTTMEHHWIGLHMQFCEFRGGLPECGGVYAIYANNDLVYIGQSICLRTRLLTHMRTYKMSGTGEPVYLGNSLRTVTKWTIKFRPAQFFGDWATIELRLIRRLNPICNKTHKRRLRVA